MDFLAAFFLLAQRPQPVETINKTGWVEVPGTGFAASSRTSASPPVLVKIDHPPQPGARLAQLITDDAGYALIWLECETDRMTVLRQGAFISENQVGYSTVSSRISPNDSAYWRKIFNFVCRN